MLLLLLDIDDTLADTTHRKHFIETEGEEDWDSFFDEDLVAEDRPIPESQDGFEALKDKVDKFIFVTGRPERLRDVTVDWLSAHFGVRPDTEDLYMREEDDFSPSADYKESIIRELLRGEFGDYTGLMIDDDPEILEMFERYGIALRAPGCWEVIGV